MVNKYDDDDDHDDDDALAHTMLKGAKPVIIGCFF